MRQIVCCCVRLEQDQNPSYAREFLYFIDAQPPALVVAQMQVQHVQSVLGHDLYHLQDSVLLHEVSHCVQL